MIVADALGDRIALRFPLVARIPIVDPRAHAVGEINLDLRVALLERDPDARERAAGADRAGETINLAVGLFPDLGAGRLVMAAAVGEVVELVRPYRPVRFARRDLLGELS